MDSIEQAVQSMEALGLSPNVKENTSTVTFSKIIKPDLMSDGDFGSYHVLGHYDSNDGQYSLHLGMAANSPLAQDINTRVNDAVNRPNGEQLRNQISEIGQGVLDEVKEELDIPDDVRIGGIGVSVSYLVDIVLTGTNLEELYERLRPLAEKLDYTI